MKSTFTKILILICITVIAIQSDAQDDTVYNVVEKDNNGQYFVYKINKVKQYPLFILDSSLTQKEIDSMSNFVKKIERNFDTVHYSVFWVSVSKVHVHKTSYEAYGKVQPNRSQQYYIKTVVTREEIPERFLWKNLFVWIGSVIVLFFASYLVRRSEISTVAFLAVVVYCIPLILIHKDTVVYRSDGAYSDLPTNVFFTPLITFVLLGFLFRFLCNKYIKKK